MKVFRDISDPQIPLLLKQGAIGVIPTDTLYGVVACANNQRAVERVYHTKHRYPDKACIVLIGSHDQITDTKLWTPKHWQVTKQYWPGPVSVIVPSQNIPAYLHRGTYKARYRLPNYPDLQRFLLQTGPLIAPSANLEGQPPATTIEAAQAYFGDEVDFYVDGGSLNSVPSTLIEIVNDKIRVVRPGGTQIDQA